MKNDLVAVVVAYGIVYLAIVLYTLYLGLRERRASAEMLQIRRLVAQRSTPEDAPADTGTSRSPQAPGTIGPASRVEAPGKA